MDFIFIILTSIISALFGYLRYKYSYWELKDVPQLKMHFFFGNLFRLKSIHQSEIFHAVYQQFRGKAKLAGTYIYTQPICVILDLDLVKAILIKDFHKFTDRFKKRNDIDSPITLNLFSLYGEKWRALRTKLTPTFTSSKMKFMFPTIVSVARQLESAFEQQLRNSPDGTIELHDMSARFTTDVIGNCAFGLECNSLKNPQVEFRRIGRRIFYPQYVSIRLRTLMITYPKLFRLIGRKRFPQDIEDFIMQLVRDTVKMREEQQIQRNDFINLLLELKNSKDLKSMPGMTIEELAAQVFIFFAAGFETSSSNMSYGLYELARNPHVQDKVRAEILRVLEQHNGELSYEAMMEMTYLDQVISETLRKYPALAALSRVAVDNYEVPGTNITLDKDTRVYIPVKEIHYDPDIYDNPKEFRPERFNPEEVQKRHPQAFLGFGDGPRNCIGLRFGRMQARIGLITLLKSFKFSFAEKTPAEIEISKYSIVLVPHGGVWLKAEKLDSAK